MQEMWKGGATVMDDLKPPKWQGARFDSALHDQPPMDDLMLPPLPEPELNDGVLLDNRGNYRGTFDGFTADQMREYAKAAVAVERKALERKIANDLRQAGYTLVWTARGYRVMDLGYVSAQPAPLD